MPFPLLSEVIQNLNNQKSVKKFIVDTDSTDDSNFRRFDLSDGEERKPIMLYKTPLSLANPQPYNSTSSNLSQPSSSRASALSSGERIRLNLSPSNLPQPSSSRASALGERTPLNLLPRTKPLELPPYQEPRQNLSVEKRVHLERNQRKQQQIDKVKRRMNIIQQAFNST